ncbi:PEP-CTERM sorting domain-containing protein [Nostoc sp. UHCC 0702]|nr:PEP-CTERM sorting domain-containing protein [Nostoc sp. UHCC 0702]
MKISPLIQGLSMATVLLVAGLPAYGASINLTTPEVQLDNDPILDIAGRPGDIINFTSVNETFGLIANLQSITLNIVYDSNEISAFGLERSNDDAQFFPNLSRQTSFDPNTGLTTIIGVRSGPPGLTPNTIYEAAYAFITLGSQLNNDGKVDYRVAVTSAIDASGRDVTALFGGVQEEFEVQPVPEPSNIFGLVLALGFGAFLRKQKRKVLTSIELQKNL